MKKLSGRIALLGIIFIVLLLSAFTISGRASSLEAGNYANWQSFHSAETRAAIGDQEGFTPPSPDENPCLHCHIAGQEIGAWTPLYRWFSFGTMGLIFLFGMTRNLSTWQTKEKWMPVGTRVSNLISVTDPLSAHLDKPAPKWQRQIWYYLGGATLVFFFIQLISGTIGAFHYDPLVFDEFTDTHASLILSIKASHWGLGIIILATVLIFNFIGTLLSSEQRSYWATMLILSAILGIPAIVQLSTGYLNPEVSIPTSHLYALHIMLISTLAATLTGMYLVITAKGEAK